MFAALVSYRKLRMIEVVDASPIHNRIMVMGDNTVVTMRIRSQQRACIKSFLFGPGTGPGRRRQFQTAGLYWPDWIFSSKQTPQAPLAYQGKYYSFKSESIEHDS